MVQSLGTTFTYRGTDADYPYTLTPELVFDEYGIVSPNEVPLFGTVETDETIRNTHWDWLMDDLPMPTAVDSAATPEGHIVRKNLPVRPRLQSQTTPIVESVEVTKESRGLDIYGMVDPFWVELTRVLALLVKQFEAQLWFGTYQLGVPNATPGSGTARRGAGLLDWATISGEGRANGVNWTVQPNSATDSAYGSFWQHPDAALTESGFNDMFQYAYEGGCPVGDSILHVSPTVKRVISEFNFAYQASATSGAHTVQMSRVMQEANQRNVAMDFYKSDFGVVPIIINRYFNDTLLNGREVLNTLTTSAADYWAKLYGNDLIFGMVPEYVRIKSNRPFFWDPKPSVNDTVVGAVGGSFGVYPINPKALYGRSNVGGANDSNTA